MILCTDAIAFHSLEVRYVRYDILHFSKKIYRKVIAILVTPYHRHLCAVRFVRV